MEKRKKKYIPNVITVKNSKKLSNNLNHIQLNNIKAIECMADKDILSVQIDVEETVFNSRGNECTLYWGIKL